ncbi:hypothetical protein DSUL_40122 [Desulfovibrionales bacterium]
MPITRLHIVKVTFKINAQLNNI